MNWPTAIVYLVFVTAWVLGIAVSKGWFMVLAIFLPPASWVLLAMHVMGG